jgi:hypothetical protein
MFRATMCPPSAENTVPMRHLVLVTLYTQMTGIQGRIPPCIPDSHLYRVTNTRCHIGTVFSPDDEHSCPKHVEKSHKHIKKIYASIYIYIYIYTYTQTNNNNNKTHTHTHTHTHKTPNRCRALSGPSTLARGPLYIRKTTQKHNKFDEFFFFSYKNITQKYVTLLTTQHPPRTKIWTLNCHSRNRRSLENGTPTKTMCSVNFGPRFIIHATQVRTC